MGLLRDRGEGGGGRSRGVGSAVMEGKGGLGPAGDGAGGWEGSSASYEA